MNRPPIDPEPATPSAQSVVASEISKLLADTNKQQKALQSMISSFAAKKLDSAIGKALDTLKNQSTTIHNVLRSATTPQFDLGFAKALAEIREQESAFQRLMHSTVFPKFDLGITKAIDDLKSQQSALRDVLKSAVESRFDSGITNALRELKNHHSTIQGVLRSAVFPKFDAEFAKALKEFKGQQSTLHSAIKNTHLSTLDTVTAEMLKTVAKEYDAIAESFSEIHGSAASAASRETPLDTEATDTDNAVIVNPRLVLGLRLLFTRRNFYALLVSLASSLAYDTGKMVLLSPFDSETSPPSILEGISPCSSELRQLVERHATNGRCEVHKSPSLRSRVVHYLSAHTIVDRLEDRGNWVRIRVAPFSPGQDGNGWIESKHLSIIKR